MSHALLAPRTFLLAGMICLAGSTVLTAQIPRPAKAISWPTGSRPALTYSVAQEPFDGVNITIGIISGPDISWANSLFTSWAIAKDPAGYSITFLSKRNPDLKLGIALFGPSEFLPDISETVWAGYLAGLQQQHENKCEILDQLSATIDSSPWVPVLGTKTRSITFRYPVDETHYNAETQLFAFCDNRLVVFVLSGPEKEVQAATPAFYSAVRAIHTYTPGK